MTPCVKLVRRLFVITSMLVILSGCSGLPLLADEVLVRPERIGHGHFFTLKLWGSTSARYRFMGARKEDGAWIVRIDPVFMGVYNQPSEISASPGDKLPLGSNPSIMVEFVEITPTQLVVRALSVHNQYREDQRQIIEHGQGRP